MPHKKLTLKQWTNFKTQPCKNPSCPTAQMFSTEVRARYYQLVFLNDKCCFTCPGYHTEHDKRRKIFDFEEGKSQLKQLFECSSEYLIDFSCFQNKKKINQNNPEIFGHTSKNLVEYLYHPANYKGLKCPFTEKYQQKSQNSSSQNSCIYEFCPFFHKDQILDSQLQKTLTELKLKTQKSQGLKKPDSNADRRKFQDKLLNIMLLRSCKSIDDLYKKEVNLIANSQENGASIALIPAEESTQSLFPVEDVNQIQKIKQKLKQKAQEHLKIDRLRQNEQHSRKVIDKHFSKEKEKNISKNQLPEQCQTDDLGVSYNYFKYGQKLSLIEGRTIEFKHFKDISDPNHIPLIMRYIAAFLNTQGGKLYIGIDDNSYAYGAKFKQSEYDKLLLKIDNEGKFYMTPPLMPQKYNIKLIPVYHDRKGQERWVIEIMVFPPKQPNKKLFLYNRECYMRMNASTHKLNAIDIIELMSLNNQNQGQAKQEDTIIETNEHKHQNQRTKIADHTPKNKRQNQHMGQASPNPNSNSKSQQKFQTQESKINQFEAKLKSKSIEDLYALRKDYEEKLKIITQAYKKKERQVR